MLDLDTSTDTFTLLGLDFDPEVACFRADRHGLDPELHDGAPTARFYMTMTCQHCDTGAVVRPVCNSYKEFAEMLQSEGQVWVHDPGCQGSNDFAESIEFTPITLTDH